MDKLDELIEKLISKNYNENDINQALTYLMLMKDERNKTIRKLQKLEAKLSKLINKLTITVS